MRAPLLLVAALAACGATSNPERGRLAPVTSTPSVTAEGQPAAAQGQPAAAPNQPAAVQAQPAAAQGQPAAAQGQPVAAQSAEPKTPVVAVPEPAPLQPVAPSATPQPAPGPQLDGETAQALLLGRVGDRALDSASFLRKLWVADNRVARRVLEQMVFAELATLESDRLGIRLMEPAVDAALERATRELERKLVEKGSKLTLREHIDQVIGVEPELYIADLRDETIVQLLAERCVRAWMVETDRCDVRLTEVRSAEARAAFEAGLKLGKGFDELALAHGEGDDAATHTTSMRLARAEAQELPRVVFATPQGTVGGPLEQDGRWLFFVSDRRIEGRPGTWVELREEVEKSLASDPVGDMEFLQWRAAMVRRYKVELDPFFDLVERRRRTGR